MRYFALKELGYKDIPDAWVKRANELTETEKQRFIIADNLSFGEWDWELLATDWDAKELSEWGLELPETANILEAAEDDYVQPDVIETDIVLGDLFEIGQHRLLCGDSTDSDAVAKLMNGQKADMVFTDPPYGISVVSNNKICGDKVPTFGGVVGGGGGATKKGKNKIVDAKIYNQIIGDDTTDTAREFYKTCISLGMDNFIIWGGNYFTDFLPVSACWIVWDKENSGNFADVEIAWTSFNKGSKLYKWLWNGMSRKGERCIEGATRVHPTQKPVGLFNDIFKDFDFKTCFDGFGGYSVIAFARKSIGLSIKPFFKQPFEGPIKIEVAYFCAVKDKKKWGKHKTSRPDLDNYIKNTLDSLNLIAYKDDSQICSVTAQKIWTEWPSTHVWITPL
jgi:Holliday junction resolvase RusA-like endonuclease